VLCQKVCWALNEPDQNYAADIWFQTHYFFAILVVATCAVCAAAIVPLASKLARALELVDAPDKRKTHVGEIPLAGGMVILAGLWGTTFFLPSVQLNLSSFAY